MAKDNTDSGAKSAIYAEVLQPSSDVKAKWFEVLVNNPEELKLSTLRYIIWGLFPFGQEALEAPFKDRILAHVKTLNDGSDLSLLEAFSGLITTQCNTESEAELAKLVEEYKDMKPQVLKTVKAKHERVGRCVKVLNLLK
jgi:aminopeptidase N